MPNQPIRALIGGFHLYDTPDEEVRALAGRMKNEGVELAYTGHCTGDRAFKILQEELGEDVIKATKSGAHRAGRIESSRHERKPRTAHASASERFQ